MKSEKSSLEKGENMDCVSQSRPSVNDYGNKGIHIPQSSWETLKKQEGKA